MPINHPSTTILFIDDHKEDRQYWAQRLRTLEPDYIVLEAETGKAGLAFCRSQKIDCVVVELSLPDMSGFEVLVQLTRSALRPEMAVVVLTALSNPYLLELALKNGAQAALRKTGLCTDLFEDSILKAIATIRAR